MPSELHLSPGKVELVLYNGKSALIYNGMLDLDLPIGEGNELVADVISSVRIWSLPRCIGERQLI